MHLQRKRLVSDILIKSLQFSPSLPPSFSPPSLPFYEFPLLRDHVGQSIEYGAGGGREGGREEGRKRCVSESEGGQKGGREGGKEGGRESTLARRCATRRLQWLGPGLLGIPGGREGGREGGKEGGRERCIRNRDRSS